MEAINYICKSNNATYDFKDEDFEIMKKDIIICKELGVETVVFGILNKNNTIDIDRTRELVDLAQGLKVTFHMAFDEIYDKFKALEQLISIGVDRVLTKGGKDCAEEGKVVLKELVEKSKGKVIILVGGKVTYKNYKTLSEFIGCKEVHGSKIVGDLN